MRRWAIAAIGAVAVAIAAGAASQIASEFFARRVAAIVNDRVEPRAALSSRALIIIIDGLRHDLALESERFPIARELAATGASGVCIAEDPTMSGAGVRALGTGTPPVFSDFVTNLNMPPVDGDHLFSSLARSGHVVAAVGSRSWTQLFGGSIAIQETESGLPSLVARMQPVNRPDAAFVKKALAVLRARRSTVTVVHLFGADALSHARGPLSDSYTKKLAELDLQVRELIAACPDCSVILTSDHGASDRGHHGLGEEIARRTPLVLHGPGIRAGVTFVAAQRDVAPTVATLLGAPVPGPAQGRVLVEALTLDPAAAARVTLANAERLARYLEAHGEAFDAALAIPDLPHPDDGDSAAVSAAAEAATTRMLETLHGDRVSRTRWLLIWLPLLLLAALLTTLATPPGPRVHRRVLIAAVIATLVVEVGFVIWRANATLWRREVLESPVIRALPSGVAGAVLCVLAAGVATWVSRRSREAHADRRIAVLLLAGLAAFATAEDLLACFVIGGVAAALRGARGLTLAIGALGLVTVLATLVLEVRWSSLPAGVTTLAFGGAVVGLAGWQGRGGGLSRRILGGPLVTLGGGVALHLAGRPDLATWGYLVAALVAMIGMGLLRIDPVAKRWAIGWCAMAILLVLSEPSQLPALVGVAAIVAAASTLPRLTALHLALLVIGGRILILYALEGRFSYSDIEWHVGKVGNPSSKAIGHAMIAVKYALPSFALLGIVGAVQPTRAIVAGGAWALASLLVFMLHSAASLQISAGQYHTPYVDISTLLGAAAIVASLALAWAWFALQRERPGGET